MKKINILTLTLLLLLGFASCQKAEINQNDDQKTHTVTFVAGAPETKTTVDIEGTTAKFSWTKNDESRFEVYENGVKASEAIGVLGADGIMTLSATFDGSAPESPSYQALYNTAVSSAQTANDLYDETADVLVSAVLTDTDRKAAGYLFSFKRESAIAKMTLKGLTDGAFVNSVTINSDKDIAGTYDLANGIFTSTSKTITITALSTITGGEATVWFASVPVEDATFTVTATTVDNDENVVATYTKTFTKTITLTRGDVKGFGVAMEPAVVTSPKETYNRVTSTADIEEGEYIIGMAHNDDLTVVKYLENTTKTKPSCQDFAGDITISEDGNTITVDPTTVSNAKWSFDAVDGGYSISSVADKPAGLGTTSSNDGLTTQTTYLGNAWTITVNDESFACTLKFVSTSRFLNVYSLENPRTYTSSTTNNNGKIYLYKKYDPRTAIEAPTNLIVSAEKVVSWDAVDGAASYVLTIGSDEYPCETNSCNASEIADEYYDVAVVAVPSDTENYKNSAPATLTNAKFGTPTLATPTLKEGAVDEFSVNATWTVDARATKGYNCELFNGETKVGESKTVTTGSVTFDGLDDGVTYTIKVNAIAVEGEKPYAASAVAEIELTTKGTVTLSQITEAGTYTVKNVTVYAVIGTTTAVIGDGTAYFYLYKSSHGLKVGNTFTVGGTVKAYNGVWEFDSPTISNKETGSTPTYENAVEADEAYLTSYASAPITEYIHAKGTQSGKNITIGSQKLYLSATNDATDGKDVEVYGFVYGYNSSYSNISFYAISIAEDLTVPKLTVSPTSKTWANDEVDAATFTVTTNTEGEKGWTVSPETLDWAEITVNKTAGTITVTPKDVNTSDTAREATLKVTHDADNSVTETIKLTQKAASVGGEHTHSLSSKPVYTLSFTKDAAASTYTAAHTTTSSGVQWSVFGNQSVGNYLRVGGKNTTATDRTLTSKGVVSSTSNIGVVRINHSGTGNGKNTTITINSIKVEGSVNSDFSNSKVVTIDNPTVSTAGAVDFSLADADFDSNSYFKITINYKDTTTTGSSANNSYLTIDSIEFFSCTAE